MSDIRKEVIRALKDVIRAAEDQGLEGIEAARQAFPGTPDAVLYSAWVEVDHERTETWWAAVERTIDGEVIRRAIADASKNPAQEAGGDPQPDEWVAVEGIPY